MSDRGKLSHYEMGVRWKSMLEGDPCISIKQLAKDEKVNRARMTRCLQLASLPNDVIAALGGPRNLPLMKAARLATMVARSQTVSGRVSLEAATMRAENPAAALQRLLEIAGDGRERGRGVQLLSGHGQRTVGTIRGSNRPDGTLVIQLGAKSPVALKEKVLRAVSEFFPGWQSPWSSSTVGSSTRNKQQKKRS